MVKIYMAGPMATGAEPGGETRGKLAAWRLALQTPAMPGVEWLVPEAMGCDHTGIDPQRTVEGDLAMIRSADLVLAYLDSRDRWGTLFEIGYAMGQGIPVFAAVLGAAHQPQDAEVHPTHGNPWEEFTAFEQRVAQTGHACNCMTAGDGEPVGLLWFPLRGVTAYRMVETETDAVVQLRMMLWKHTQKAVR